jgi:hypothetical protein
MPAGLEGDRGGKGGSISFLKKRNKKLLTQRVQGFTGGGPSARSQLSKSFLFLFFKKEMLPFFS